MPTIAPRLGHHGTRSSSSLYESLILRRPLPVIIGALLHIAIYLAFSLSSVVTPGRSLLRPAAHAWISVDVANPAPSAQSDVEFRQAWICGRYMQALDKHTLVDALDAQNYLLSNQQPHTTTTTILGHAGDTIQPGVSSNQEDGTTPLAVVVHSILDGWGCSASAISADTDIPGTVSRQLHHQSSANITLRPASVFKGLSTSKRGLAADVVLITMMSQTASTPSLRWDEGSTSLTTIKPGWHVLRDTQPAAFARVQYLKTTSKDQAVFLALYGAAILFACLALSRRSILRSGLWLLTSIAIEVSLVTLLARHVFSSVEVAVSTVPLACYPLLPLAQCLFNVNHLISRVKRVYSYADRSKLLTLAMAEVGSAPCVRTLQALSMLLIILSLSPAAGLSSFCRFAMLSLSIDLLIFYTFFISAFVINLRMPELQDTKSEQQQNIPQHKAPVWNMKLRWSTNHLLVTAGLLYFISAHFVDLRSLLSSFGNLRLYVLRESQFWYPHSRSYRGSPTGSILDWLRVQEPETLREILQAVNIKASSFIVKSYAPLHVYTQPESRNATRILEELPTSSITAMLPIAPFLFTLIGFHSTYYSASDASEDEKGEQNTTTDSSTSLIRRLEQRHTLDLYLLTSCAGRFMVSVGFDHQIWLWNLQTTPPTSEPIPSTTEHQISWPISLVAIDDHGEWVAICSRRGQVLLWNRRLQSFGREISLDPEEKTIKVFFLKTDSQSPRLGPHRPDPVKRLLLVLDSGRLIDVDINGTECNTVQICDKPVKSSHLVSINRYAAPKLITVTTDESIFMSANRDRRWMTLPLRVAAIDNLRTNLTYPIHFSMIPTLRGVASVYNERTNELLLIDILSGAVIYTFTTEPLRHQTLRVIHATPQQCVFCGSIAVASLTIAYTEKVSGKFTMRTIAMPQPFGVDYFRSRLICMRSERDSRERRCMGFSSGEESTYCMADPGSWEATGANGVAGVRRVLVSPCGEARCEPHPGLWRRDVKNRMAAPTQPKRYQWEAWTMTAQGVKSMHELTTGLLAVTPGPLCRVGQNGIGVGLADGIVLLQFGKQLRDDDGADGETDTPTHGKLAKRRSRSGFVPR